jgi:hypothetical protein
VDVAGRASDFGHFEPSASLPVRLDPTGERDLALRFTLGASSGAEGVRAARADRVGAFEFEGAVEDFEAIRIGPIDRF